MCLITAKWHFVTHETLIIALGSFMSFQSNGGAPDQWLIFFPFLWARVSPFSFSRIYKISKGTYSHFLKKHSSTQSTPAPSLSKRSKLRRHSLEDSRQVLHNFKKLRIFDPVSAHFPSVTFPGFHP